MMQRRVALAALVAVCLPPSAALAQSKEDLARADSLFNAGKALTDSRDFVDACAKFAESKRLAPGLGVTLYLADCYEHIGKTASAWAEFRSAEGLARDRNDKRADVAHDRAQALEPKLPRLTIALAPTIPRDGVQILRDGHLVPPEEIGSAVPVDPGDHAIVVSGAGRPSKTLAAHLDAEHPSAVINIDSLEPAPDAGPSTPPPPALAAPPPLPPAAADLSRPQPQQGPDPGATRRWIGVGVGGAGVVGLGVGAVLGMMAKSQQDRSNGPAGCDATDHCTAQGLSDRKSAEGLAMGSTVAFIAGGVAVAAGAVLFLTAPRASKAGVIVVPAPMVGGGGALLSATF
jgi:serine/threonine-protein kinase